MIVTLINSNNIDIIGEEQLARFAYNDGPMMVDNFLIMHHVEIALCKRHLIFLCMERLGLIALSFDCRLFTNVHENIKARLNFKVNDVEPIANYIF